MSTAYDARPQHIVSSVIMQKKKQQQNTYDVLNCTFSNVIITTVLHIYCSYYQFVTKSMQCATHILFKTFNMQKDVCLTQQRHLICFFLKMFQTVDKVNDKTLFLHME